MTTFIMYSCNLCLRKINQGYTICYMPDGDNRNKYNLSDIEFGLLEMKDQISAGGAMISHVCNRCASDIYSEVYKKMPKAK